MSTTHRNFNFLFCFPNYARGQSKWVDEIKTEKKKKKKKKKRKKEYRRKNWMGKVETG